MNAASKTQGREIAALMKDFVDYAADFYEHLSDYPVVRPADTKTLEDMGQKTIPASGRPLREVYEELLRDVYSNTLLAQHPRSFSCIPSTASLLSWMGDVMTNAFNPHDSCRVNAPAIALIEQKLIRWLCDLAGYPVESGGIFVSGASMANLTALTAARDAKLRWKKRSEATIYVSGQTHASVSKGLHIIGFDRSQIRVVPTDSEFRMDTAYLARAIAEDAAARKRPFAVVASAGTTNTGSVDPLPEISVLCREYDMWMHVDGAFGASALLSERQRKALAGIEYSDSLSWDAHEWMMQTYGCGMVLVRNQEALVRSFAAHPEYLRDSEADGEGIEFWDLGPELTRPARCMKLWITLQALGTAKMGEVIDHSCSLAQLAEREVSRLPDWEIISHAQMGIVNFRYAPAGVSESERNELNQRISKELTDGGYAHIFTTELQGKKVLRMCTIHPQTTESDILNTIQQLTMTRTVRACPLADRDDACSQSQDGENHFQ